MSYNDPQTAALARKRANKWLADMFKPENFKAIMNSVDPVLNQDAFNTACKNAGLTSSEINWLWAYLQHCNVALYSNPNVRDFPAANSGW